MFLKLQENRQVFGFSFNFVFVSEPHPTLLRASSWFCYSRIIPARAKSYACSARNHPQRLIVPYCAHLSTPKDAGFESFACMYVNKELYTSKTVMSLQLPDIYF